MDEYVARLPIAPYDLPVVVLCQEGFASSLAAAALQDLGIGRATDVIGGYAAWRRDGVSAPQPARGGLRLSHPFHLAADA